MKFKRFSLTINTTEKKRRRYKNFSYRPNHVDGRGRNRRTTQIAPKWSPFGAGGPRLVLSYLHVIVLNKVRYWQKKY
jgi:hypothetical protein